MKSNNKIAVRYGFALIILFLGLLFNYFKLGSEFFGFGSPGSWLIYISIVMFAIITLQALVNKKRIVDERMMQNAHKASRVTFLFIILASFSLMIIDGISPIQMRYHLFLSYAICAILLVYIIAYKIIDHYS